MAVLFSALAPAKIIHVAVGSGAADGSEKRPYHSIQAAVDAAAPGTAIVVHAGVYKENVKIAWRDSGTAEAPIWLVSGDGAQKAVISAPDATKPVIQALGVDNYLIMGFSLTGGYDGIQFSQSGRDFSNLVNNVVVQGNRIDHVVHDGIKIGQANNVQILDNSISNVHSEEAIDFVAVTNAVIARNEVSNITNKSAAIFAKGGSANVIIEDNFIHDVTGDGVAAGGNTDSSSFKPGYAGYEAKNVDIIGNRVEDVGKRPISVRGAIDIQISDNFLEAGASYGNAVYVTSGSQNSSKPIYSKDVRITGNVVEDATAIVKIDAGNDNAISQNANHSQGWLGSVGPATVKLPSWTGAKDAPSPDPADHESSAAQNRLSGTSGNDLLVGTTKADRMDGGAGDDVMRGGLGDDTYIMSDARDIVVELASQGLDTVEIYTTLHFLGANFENLVVGSKRSSFLVGNDVDNIIKGGENNDVIIGGAGQDILTGGVGTDIFYIGRDHGSDTITDFRSNDTVLLAGDRFGSFSDLKASSVQKGADTQIDLGDGDILTLRNVQLGTLKAAQFDLDDLSSAAAIGAKPGNVIVGGAALPQLLQGTSGRDLLDGKGGGDLLIGGDGDDTYAIRNANDVVIEHSGGGIDSALVYTSAYAMAAGVENATAMGGGGATMEGNAAANRIIGGEGNDRLIGGGGFDVLTGGKGADLFQFLKSGAGADILTDFKRGEDKLDFSKITENEPDGNIIFRSVGGNITINFNYDGDIDLLATLVGVNKLELSDYII